MTDLPKDIDTDDEPEMTPEQQQAEELRLTRNKLAETTASLNAAQKEIQSKDAALELTRRQIEQLEENIRAVRSQRDYLIEREADALVDQGLLRRQAAVLKKNLDTLQDAAQKNNDTLQARLIQAENALNEVRNKFGQAKHEEKVAQRNLKVAAETHDLSLEAMVWFTDIMDTVRFSVFRRYHKATGEDLTPEAIIRAYRVKSLSRKFLDIDGANLVRFLVNPEKFL